MATDGLAMQGAKASAGMALAKFPGIPISAPKGLNTLTHYSLVI